MKYLLFDVDGVLADCTHRLHYLKNKDYDSFYSNEELEKDIEDKGWELLYYLTMPDTKLNVEHKFIIITGRPKKTMPATLMWLYSHNTQQLFFKDIDAFYCRENDDYRPSRVVKKELVEKCIDDFGITVSFDDSIFFVDDDPANCQAVSEIHRNIIALTFGAERFDNIRSGK